MKLSKKDCKKIIYYSKIVLKKAIKKVDQVLEILKIHKEKWQFSKRI